MNRPIKLPRCKVLQFSNYKEAHWMRSHSRTYSKHLESEGLPETPVLVEEPKLSRSSPSSRASNEKAFESRSIFLWSPNFFRSWVIYMSRVIFLLRKWVFGWHPSPQKKKKRSFGMKQRRQGCPGKAIGNASESKSPGLNFSCALLYFASWDSRTLVDFYFNMITTEQLIKLYYF